MSNHSEIMLMIAEFSGQKNSITIPRVFVKFMGDLNGALFLNQLIFWSDKGRGEWFYKSHDEWENDVCLSAYNVRKWSKKCVDLGFLKTKVKKVSGNPTLHYLFDQQKFSYSLMKFLINQENENFNERKSNFSDSLNTEEYIQKKTTEDKENRYSEFVEFCELWKKYYPQKPQPRSNNKNLQSKFESRFNEPLFVENYVAALKRGSTSTFLTKTWAGFDANWFLKNDSNWEKVFNGNYDNPGKQRMIVGQGERIGGAL